MKESINSEDNTHSRLFAEFDLLADEYNNLHKKNIKLSGEGPEYFSEYKIADLAAAVSEKNLPKDKILDFGSGIGNSIPYFRKYFPDSALTCCDISSRSLTIAKNRFGGRENYVLIRDKIPLNDGSQSIVFSACVFHHIPENQHAVWLTELLRIVRPGGLLAIYEHNPFNPITRYAVNTCALDVNAKLIRASKFQYKLQHSGWVSTSVSYKAFFPSFLKFLRPVEPYLRSLCLGAQYRVTAFRKK